MKNPSFRVQTADFVPEKHGKITYQLNIPAETNIEDLLHPEAWVNITNFQTILPGSFIRCIKADFSMVCDLFVVGVDKKKGLFAELYYLKDFRKSEVATESCEEVAPAEEKNKEDSEYKIVFSGPNKKHVIIRKSDNEEIEIGISSKKEALEIIKTLSK